MRPRAPSPGLRPLGFALLLALLAETGRARSLLPLFRQPKAAELSEATAAGAALVWSAHQPEDEFLVVSDGAPLAVACLFDDVHPADPLQLELSWIVENEATGTEARHTLTASGGGVADVNGSSKQTFTLDLGPGLQPASGVFHRFSGSVLTLAFPAPPPVPGPLSVACQLHLAGALGVRSARLRLWDERPAEAALVGAQAGGLACRRTQHRLPAASFSAVTLDCEWPSSSALPPQSLLLLEAAVFGLYVNAGDNNCADDSARPRLQSNSTEPSVFFALAMPGRGTLRPGVRIGWANEGDGALLQNRLAGPGGGGELCVSADATLPSGRRRLRLRWRAHIVGYRAEWNATNSSAAGDFGGDAFAFGLGRVGGDNGTAAEISIDRFSDPPLPRALPCPYLCPSTAAGSPLCKFAWIHSEAAHPSAANFFVASSLTDPSSGILPNPHTLLLMPWQLPGNPNPPPQAGTWTCRSHAAISSGVKAHAASLTPVFRVTVSARTSFCASQMPRKSVVFLGTSWSARQSLAINCTVCGTDGSVDAQLAILGSVGADGVSVEPTSRQQLPGGALELGLRFARFGDDTRPGSVLVRCRAVDRRGRGAVAFSVVEVVAAPADAALSTDCDGGGTGGDECRRFRCPMEPGLTASLRLLPVTISYLFSLQLHNAAPPQQVLSSSDRLLADARVSRVRCTQLIYYSQMDASAASSRRQLFLSPDPAAAATYRAALGGSRFSRLILAIESGWLVVPDSTFVPRESDESLPLASAAGSDFQADAYSPTRKSDMVDEIIGAILVICVVVAIVFAVMFFIRGRQLRAAKAATTELPEGGGPESGAAPATGAAATASPAAEPETQKRPKRKKKKKPDGEKSGSDSDKGSEDDKKKKKKKKKKVKHEDVDKNPDESDKSDKKSAKKKHHKAKGELDASHNVSSSALIILDEPSGFFPPPQNAFQTRMHSDATTTSSEEIAEAHFGMRLCRREVDHEQGPEMTCICSPAVRSWRKSDVTTTFAGNLSAIASAAVTTTTALTTLSGCRTAHTVIQEVSRVKSRRANQAQTDGCGAPSSLAAIQSSGSPHHALRIGLSPELHIEFLALPDDLPDAASSDEPHRLPGSSPPPLNEHRCHVTAKLPEAARVARCLICQPPRVRLASVKFGVEVSAFSSSSPSIPTPPPRESATVVEVTNPEVDVPLSEPWPQTVASTTGTSTMIADIVKSETEPRPVFLESADDLGSTRSGGWSESPVENAMAISAESDDECRRLILDAVRNAIDRSLTCD